MVIFREGIESINHMISQRRDGFGRIKSEKITLEHRDNLGNKHMPLASFTKKENLLV